MIHLLLMAWTDKAEVLKLIFSVKGPSPYPSMSNIDVTIQGIVKLCT